MPLLEAFTSAYRAKLEPGAQVKPSKDIYGVAKPRREANSSGKPKR